MAPPDTAVRGTGAHAARNLRKDQPRPHSAGRHRPVDSFGGSKQPFLVTGIKPSTSQAPAKPQSPLLRRQQKAAGPNGNRPHSQEAEDRLHPTPEPKAVSKPSPPKCWHDDALVDEETLNYMLLAGRQQTHLAKYCFKRVRKEKTFDTFVSENQSSEWAPGSSRLFVASTPQSEDVVRANYEIDFAMKDVHSICDQVSSQISRQIAKANSRIQSARLPMRS